MAEKKIRIHNKSDRPDNIIERENNIYMQCEAIEKKNFPVFERILPLILRATFCP